MNHVAHRATKLSLASILVLLAACGHSEPPPVDPSQASGSNAAAMGQLKTPTYEELALKEAQLQRDHSLEAAAVEERSEAREAEQRRNSTRTTTGKNGNGDMAGTSATAEGAANGTTDNRGAQPAPTPGVTPTTADPQKRVTAMDQGNNSRDLSITQDIRKAVMGDPSLSFAAKNVTVVTTGGRVTLMGKVKDQAERDNVASKAKRYAGEGRVDDRLEVKK